MDIETLRVLRKEMLVELQISFACICESQNKLDLIPSEEECKKRLEVVDTYTEDEMLEWAFDNGIIGELID